MVGCLMVRMLNIFRPHYNLIMFCSLLAVTCQMCRQCEQWAGLYLAQSVSQSVRSAGRQMSSQEKKGQSFSVIKSGQANMCQAIFGLK